MSYEDSSNVLNVMCGVRERQKARFEWRNMTSDFASAVKNYSIPLGHADVQLTYMCSSSPSPFLVYCFTINKQDSRPGIAVFQVFSNATSTNTNISDIQVKGKA